MITLYGIPNCDTMKKARSWLNDHVIDYTLHDYKKLGAPETELKRWVKQLSWETLLNRNGTSWRKLDAATKDKINQANAIKLMLENPSMIKRPVLDVDGQLLVGFSEENYEKLFSAG